MHAHTHKHTPPIETGYEDEPEMLEYKINYVPHHVSNRKMAAGDDNL